MALHSLGTNATTSLVALRWFPGLAPGTASNIPQQQVGLQDIQLLNNQILLTGNIGAFLNQTGANGILMTATTAGSATLTVLASTGGVGLAAIQPGAAIIGASVPPGTFIVSRTPLTGAPTSLVMSNVATNSLAGQRFIVLNQVMTGSGNAAGDGLDPATGRVMLPDNRGYIQLNPGDYVAVDPSGAVIVLPANSVSYLGSVWTFV
jgi:hypothetical protein